MRSQCCAVESRVLAGGKDRAALLTETSLILAAVFWGTNYAATKFAALSVPPLSIVALRFAVGGLLMYCVLRVLEPESRLGRADVLPMLGLGCLGVALGQTTFTFGVSMTTAANTGLIFATAPVCYGRGFGGFHSPLPRLILVSGLFFVGELDGLHIAPWVEDVPAGASVLCAVVQDYAPVTYLPQLATHPCAARADA